MLTDGNFLTVIENMQTGKAEKENPENWDARNDERFLELYGPIGSTSYRFDRWMDSNMKQQKIELNEVYKIFNIQ